MVRQEEGGNVSLSSNSVHESTVWTPGAGGDLLFAFRLEPNKAFSALYSLHPH